MEANKAINRLHKENWGKKKKERKKEGDAQRWRAPRDLLVFLIEVKLDPQRQRSGWGLLPLRN